MPGILRHGGSIAAWVTPVAADAQLAGGTGPEISWIRILAALALCLAAAGVLALLLRRYGSGLSVRGFGEIAARLRQTRRLSVIESCRIAAHTDLCLIRCDDREYLLFCGPSKLQLLAHPGPEQRLPEQ